MVVNDKFHCISESVNRVSIALCYTVKIVIYDNHLLGLIKTKFSMMLFHKENASRIAIQI